jgi:flagellar hook-associated protein 2
MSFSEATGLFSLDSRGVGAINGNITFGGGAAGFFNNLGININNIAPGNAAVDAIVYVDGNRFVRSSNNFEIDGLTFRIDPDTFVPEMVYNSTTSTYSPATFQLTLTRDVSHTAQMIRDFVEQYNTLIRSIRDLTETRRPRSGTGAFFMPLTEEERRAMSDREIEMWEEQARTGLLHRDDTLRRLTSELHRVMFEDVTLPDGSKINMLHLGIRTHSDLTRFGELQIDEDRLDHFLNNRMDDVAHLFTRQSTIHTGGAPSPQRSANRRAHLSDSGIGQRIHQVLTWELSMDGGLATRAGAGAGTDTNNFLTRRITQEERRIDDMIRDLQRREHRYFAMFSRLEAALMQSQSQMMFMEQMFWGAV